MKKGKKSWEQWEGKVEITFHKAGILPITHFCDLRQGLSARTPCNLAFYMLTKPQKWSDDSCSLLMLTYKMKLSMASTTMRGRQKPIRWGKTILVVESCRKAFEVWKGSIKSISFLSSQEPILETNTRHMEKKSKCSLLINTRFCSQPDMPWASTVELDRFNHWATRTDGKSQAAPTRDRLLIAWLDPLRLKQIWRKSKEVTEPSPVQIFFPNH